MDQSEESETSSSVLQSSGDGAPCQDCVRLTEEQYVGITKLARNPQFGGVMGKKHCFPVWEQLVENESSDDCFAWPVYSGWLGALKFGLVLEGVDGGGELYSRILPIFEKLAEEMERKSKRTVGVYPSLLSYLWFRHVGDGWFRLEVEHGKMTSIANPSEESSHDRIMRKFQKMASDAFHVRRTQKHQVKRFCHAFIKPVEHMPGNSEANLDQDLQYIEGCQSPAFREELKLTIAYVALQMEKEGEGGDLMKLNSDMKMKSTGMSTSPLSLLGLALDAHIGKYGYSLLTCGSVPASSLPSPPESSSDSDTPKRKAQSTSAVVELEEQLGGRLSACTGLKLDLPTVCQYSVPVKAGSKKEETNRVQDTNLAKFLEENFQATELPSLKHLTVRRVDKAIDAAGLLWECLQCVQLSELDLEGCNITVLEKELQFWGLPNLKVLNLNNTQLSFLPASIGRLKRLRVLSLNTNYLRTLPNTISFCRQLEELNLESNGFSYLPGVILQLKSLKTLRRWGNSELMRGAGDLSHNRCNKYISIAPEMVLGSAQDAPGGGVTPLKLLALQRIMTSRIDYWGSTSLAPVVCKILDNAQSQFKICDHCFVAKPLEVRGYKVSWLMESILGLRHVPFQHFACSLDCASALESGFNTTQTRLMAETEAQYRRQMRQYGGEEDSALGEASSSKCIVI